MKSSVGVKLFEYNFDDKNIVFGPYLACYVPLRNQGSFGWQSSQNHLRKIPNCFSVLKGFFSKWKRLISITI
jgi:hypothetical protein